jgi:hypothetical protein
MVHHDGASGTSSTETCSSPIEIRASPEGWRFGLAVSAHRLDRPLPWSAAVLQHRSQNRSANPYPAADRLPEPSSSGWSSEQVAAL